MLKKLRIAKSGLIWDKWNIKHIGKHNVTRLEIEEIFKEPVRTKRSYKGRLVVFGKTKAERLLAVVLEKEKSGCYTLTARDASRKERKAL